MKNFRKIALFLSLAMLVALFATGCSTAETPAESGESSQTDETTPEATEGEFTIRLAHNNQPFEENIVHYTALQFEQMVEERSEGRIAVELFPGGQLGEEVDQIRSIQNGSLEMTWGSMGNFATFAPQLNYFTLPYMFTSGEEVKTVIRNMWDQNVEWTTESGGMRPVAYGIAGFRNLSTDENNPVTTLADAEGVKVRVPTNPVSTAVFAAFGFEPIALPYSETFTALQSGVVNGQENALVSIKDANFYEAQTYVTDIQWQYTIGAFCISEDFLASLPEDLQTIVLDAGREATELNFTRYEQSEASDKQFLEDEGMVFLGQPEDYDQWVELGRSTWEDLYGTLTSDNNAEQGKEIVDMVLESLQ